jgi:quercetin dioxygenase-like cupin family protein
MEVQPQKPSNKAPAERFTGDVWIDAIAEGAEPSRVRVNKVRFAPGARTAWHAHALGQTLHVLEGAGRAQTRGQPILELRPGESIYTPPDEWHWHGAHPENFMTHLSITEGTGDPSRPESSWGAHVTDAEYLGRPR